MPESREVLRCRHCSLNQFMTSDKHCRRCHKSLLPDPPPVVAEVAAPIHARSVSSLTASAASFGIPQLLIMLRWAFNLSQKDLARMLGTQRTYVSKVERGHCLPTLANIARIAGAFDLSAYAFMHLAEVICNAE